MSVNTGERFLLLKHLAHGGHPPELLSTQLLHSDSQGEPALSLRGLLFSLGAVFVLSIVF